MLSYTNETFIPELAVVTMSVTHFYIRRIYFWVIKQILETVTTMWYNFTLGPAVTE